MRVLLPVAVLSFALAPLPALAQDYFTTAAKLRNGNGYTPATIVAGSEAQFTFTLLSIANGGERITEGVKGLDWQAILITAPKATPEDEGDEVDERYLDRRFTAPPAAAPRPPAVERKEVVYSSRTCPALLTRMEALKPLLTFEFNPPSLSGNQDGPRGPMNQGYDLWVRVGDAELDKAASTSQSMLGRWYDQTLTALNGCPSAPAPRP